MKTLITLLLSISTIISFAQAPVNRNGLKFERITQIVQPAVLDSLGNVVTPESKTIVETGRIVGIEVTLSPNAAIATPHVRKLELLSCTEEIDLEMIVQCRVNYYALDGLTRMTDLIEADTSLSIDAKALKKQLFQSYSLEPKRTRDSWVNPATGAFVEAGTPGAIREIQWYQALTKAHLVAMGLDVASETREQFLRAYTQSFMLLNIANRVGI